MRDFRIPFTETEEEKLFFGFSLREATVIFCSVLISLIPGLLLFVLVKKPLTALIPALPILALTWWTAKGKVLAVKGDKDSRIPVVEFYLRRKAAKKPKSYINYTRGE